MRSDLRVYDVSTVHPPASPQTHNSQQPTRPSPLTHPTIRLASHRLRWLAGDLGCGASPTTTALPHAPCAYAGKYLRCAGQSQWCPAQPTPWYPCARRTCTRTSVVSLLSGQSRAGGRVACEWGYWRFGPHRFSLGLAHSLATAAGVALREPEPPHTADA
eukprot:7292812-Prymnesium_polylepis.1